MFETAEELKEQCINEIAKDLCSRYPMCTCTERDGHCATPQQHARIIYGLGYIKQINAKWQFAGDGIVECSACEETYDITVLPRNYCPNCGAKMFKGVI